MVSVKLCNSFAYRLLSLKLLLSDKNKQKALHLFIHRRCSRFTYLEAWF